VVLIVKSSPIDTSIIEKINSKDNGWKAGHNEYFDGLELEDVKRLMGVIKKGTKLPTKTFEESTQALPVNFDARQQWPTCIGAVRDQGECGSCWAFGGVEALSDRFCIGSNGTIKVILAPLDPVTCDTSNDGCEGGDPYTLWQYAKGTGIVTESCAPYNDSIPTCPPSTEPCLKFVNTPACKKTCKDGSSWQASKHFAASAYAISSNVADIQTEIQTNGPVEATFSVYEDFIAYKSGVYIHTTGKLLGGHAIKIIGWGVSNTSTPYWTVQNSWTTTWGDQGYFLILRGKDECGIESGVVAGLAKV
jgi:cathepsin B